jgi:hypothetical protein
MDLLSESMLILVPQQTLYLPGPFLQEGENEIVIFEEFGAAAQIKFSQDHIFTTH